uniref:Uncharacterized protein n=1 Tax=Falco tinnunculus TaxID=100819 RepID=A0A8C4UGI3_FALTI
MAHHSHGAIPADSLDFIASLSSQRHRLCHSVAGHFSFKMPGKYSHCMRESRTGDLLNSVFPAATRRGCFSVVALRDGHEKSPGNMLRALLGRFH